jgi:proteasome lid subunit RPN8/RPN11
MNPEHTLTVAPAPVRRLVLAPGLRAALARTARAALPDEACGLLVGAREGETLSARRVRNGENLARSPRTRFELDPGVVVAAEDEARADGLEILAVWHSHPGGEARPSRTDRAGAHAGWYHVIAAVDGPQAPDGVDLRAWRTAGSGFEEVELA